MATSIPLSPHAVQQKVMNQAQKMGGFASSSLYVGDLDSSVGETQLYDIFSQVAQVVSVRVCRDQVKRVSLGYGYVNFTNVEDATTAMDLLNFTPINGQPIRIMYSHRDPSIRKSGQANVFIKNLDASIDNKGLHDTFATFGTVLSCKVAFDGNGQSKGYGFVQFEQDEAAQKAIEKLNGMLLNDKQVYVGLFVRRQERNKSIGSPKFTNIYVKNLSESTTDEDLKKTFGNYGSITSAVVMKDSSGKSKGFGFVNFEDPESAAAAVEKLNGTTSDGDRVLYVGKAQRKAERESELKAKFEQERKSRLEKLQGANLYLKNLGNDINDETLKEMFSQFGTITSCKVMLDPQGISKGSGFVAFSTPEEAAKAMNEMNGKLIGRKPLYVAVAQRKEERKANLQAHFAQIRASVPSGMPGFHPRLPGPQHLYYGQGGTTPNGLISPRPGAAGYAFQPQPFLPGVQSSGIAPNFMMPYHLQRQDQYGHHMGPRRGENPQQQFMHRNGNQSFRYMANRRNALEPTMGPRGLVGPMMPRPLNVAGGVPMGAMDVQRPGPIPMQTLASALASASPEDQRVMLGEKLYPLVERIERDHAGKVTGMLLEMDQTEVLHLIESPDALKKKVAEAMEVFRAAAGRSEGADQIGSL